MRGNARGLPRRVAEGFTLIELMIVVAIVGILAALAVPQYQIYTGRAQLVEAIHLTEGRRIAIAERMQAGRSLSSINGGLDGMPSDITSGAAKFVESLIISSGSIIATMRSTGVSPCVRGEALTLTPNVPANDALPITWTCSTAATCKPLTCG